MAKTITPSTGAPTLRTDADGFAVPLAPGEGSRAVLPRWGADRSRRFLLAHGAQSWELTQTPDGWRLLPALSRLVIRPGVHWTPAPAQDGAPPDSSDAEAKARNRLGLTVLQDDASYLSVYPGHEGTTGHFLRWERIHVYDDGAWEMVWDQAGYDAWRWSLVVDGVLQPPRRGVIAAIRSRAQLTRQRAGRTPHLEVARQAIQGAEARLAGLTEALAALEALSAPSTTGAPTTSGGKGKVVRRAPAGGPDDEEV